MKTFSNFSKNTAQLTAFYDDKTKSLRITRANGQIFNVPAPDISAPGIKVFGVSVEGELIQVFIGPTYNPQPLRVVTYTNAGIYQGSRNL